MRRFGEGSRYERLRKFVRYLAEKNVPLYGAHAGYFMVLALFPMLVLLISLLRFAGLSVDMLTDLLEGFLPAVLLPGARRLIHSTYQNTSGMVISVSALTALWSASRGVYGLLTGLNSIYQVKESRGYFHIRAVSMGYTFLFLLVLVATLILSVFGNGIVQMSPFLFQLVQLRFPMLLLMQTALFAAMFMVLPSGRRPLRYCIPGALLASVGWLVFSNLYSVYVVYFSGLSSVYGSVYAVALSMLWLYGCLCLLFYGGACNHYLMTRQKKA